MPRTRETFKECEGKWRVGKGQPARNPDDLEGVRRGIVVRGCRNAGPRERLRESRPHGTRGEKEAQRRRPQALRIFWRKGNRREHRGMHLWMSVKCKRDLVTTACSVMQHQLSQSKD